MGLFDVAGNIIGAGLSYSSAEKDRKYQKQFAQNGIQWRVADANKAGIHPLFAMNANIPMYSPASSDAGQLVAQAGQDISRSIQATRDRKAQAALEDAQQLQLLRESKRDDALAEANINRLRAETDLLISQSAETRRRSGQLGPPQPTPTGNRNVRLSQPQREITESGDRSAEIPLYPERAWRVGQDGYIRPMPSQAMADRQLDSEGIIPSVSGVDFEWRTMIAPRLGFGPYGTNPGTPPSSRDGFPLPPGYEWRYDRFHGGWGQYRIGSPRSRGRPRRISE